MTHPFHPLQGRVMEVIDHRRFGTDEYLYLEAEEGRVHRLPIGWTSLGPVEPWVAVAKNRSLFRVDDLIRLAELISELHTSPNGGAV